MDEEYNSTSIEQKKNISPVLLGSIGAVLCFIVFIVITQNPGRGGPFVILLLLFLIFLFFLLISTVLMSVANRVVPKLHLSRIRTLYTSVAIATGVVYLLGLQTLGQLQVIDVILVVIFEALLNFYLLRRF